MAWKEYPGRGDQSERKNLGAVPLLLLALLVVVWFAYHHREQPLGKKTGPALGQVVETAR